MATKVETLPVNPYTAIRRKLGSRMVPCMVSGRYLAFPEHSSVINETSDFIAIDVMTMNETNQPRKLCELVLTRQDLEAALKGCPSKD